MRITTVLFIAFVTVLSHSTLAAQAGKYPSEAAPLIAVLKAVKESDVKGFRNAYSRQIREDTVQVDWEKNLKEAKGNLRKLYGDYQLDEFTFTFRGDKAKGTVFFSHKNGKKLDLEVIMEAGEWKLNMR